MTRGPRPPGEKHGPGQQGGAGPCDPDCLKCRRERTQVATQHPPQFHVTTGIMISADASATATTRVYQLAVTLDPGAARPLADEIGAAIEKQLQIAVVAAHRIVTAWQTAELAETVDVDLVAGDGIVAAELDGPASANVATFAEGPQDLPTDRLVATPLV